MLIMKEENTQKADEIRFVLKNTIRDSGSTALYTAYTYYTVNTVFTVYKHNMLFKLLLTAKTVARMPMREG